MSRRRWMAWSLLPTLVVVGFAVVVLGRALAVERAASAYDAAVADPAAVPEAVERWEDLGWPVWFDDEVPALGRGASAVLAGDLAAARTAFEDASARSDGERRCRAAVNLVLTIEAQGDEVVELDPAAARALYQVARDEIDRFPSCRDRRQADGRGAGDRLDRAVERLDVKLAGGAAGPSEPRPVSPEQIDEEPDQDDLDDLDRALDENADARSEGPEFGEEDVGLPGVPASPQW